MKTFLLPSTMRAGLLRRIKKTKKSKSADNDDAILRKITAEKSSLAVWEAFFACFLA